MRATNRRLARCPTSMAHTGAEAWMSTCRNLDVSLDESASSVKEDDKLDEDVCLDDKTHVIVTLESGWFVDLSLPAAF